MRLRYVQSIRKVESCISFEHVLDDLSQLILHHFARALCHRGNRHEPSMAQFPIMRREHARNMLERSRQNCLSAHCAREPVKRLFVHMQVRIVRGILRRLQELPT